MATPFHILTVREARRFILDKGVPYAPSSQWFTSRRRLAVEALWVLLEDTFDVFPGLASLTISAGPQDFQGNYRLAVHAEPCSPGDKQDCLRAERRIEPWLEKLAQSNNRWYHESISCQALTRDRLKGPLSDMVSDSWRQAREATRMARRLALDLPEERGHVPRVRL